ncbi:MAG: hypothetical protein ACO1OB_34605 [Archangium sp.]
MRRMISKLSYGEHRAQTPVPTFSLVVRPDRARFHLQVAVETDSSAQALPVLRRAVQRLEELLPQLQATLTVNDFELPRDGKSGGGVSTVHATMDVPLPTGSFWDRAAKLAQADDLLQALLNEGKRQKPALDVRRDLPAFIVSDPEVHREALVKRLHERARSLAGDDAELRELHFDRAVTQQPLGLEEVALSLPVEGTLQSKVR